MKNLFKKYWHILLVIFFVPVIAIFIILKKYKVDGNLVVSLTMSALAYYGTVILAVVTLLQNEKITEISKREAEVNEIKLRNQYHPILEFGSILDPYQKEYKTTRLIKSDVDVYQVEHADDMVWMVITNKGNASAFNISYYDYGLLSEEDGEDPNKLKYDYRKRTHAEIKPGESMYLEYHISPDTMFNIDFNLCYENEYGQYFHSPMVVRLGGKGKDLYAQCGVGAQENGKSTIEVKEWYYEV